MVRDLLHPESKIRAMIYCPVSNGRRVDEIFRLLQALQTSDKNAAATPENWKPGELVIVPPPKAAETAAVCGSNQAGIFFEKYQSV